MPHSCSGSARTDERLVLTVSPDRPHPHPPPLAGEGREGVPNGFVPVAKVDELSPGQMKWVAVNGERRVLANVDGVFYAVSDVCGHRNAPLSRGKLQGYVIECPLHFAQFDIRTGKLVSGPVSTAVPVYDVLVEDDAVYIKG
jgi:nitrite reductase/ring-hydroxylating ferredoxin subunit